MTKEEKKKLRREARKKIKGIISFLTQKERELLSRAREKVKSVAGQPGKPRIGIKAWVLSNAVEAKEKLFQKGYLKKASQVTLKSKDNP